MLWLERKTLKRFIWLIVLASVFSYPIFFLLRYLDLEFFFRYISSGLIILLPTVIQSDKFRRIDKVKGLIDYHLVTSSAKDILLTRGIIGAAMGVIVLIILTPLVLLSGNLDILTYMAISVIFAFTYILLQGYITWYGYNRDISTILFIVVMAVIFLSKTFPENTHLVPLAIFSIHGVAGILALFFAENDREAII